MSKRGFNDFYIIVLFLLNYFLLIYWKVHNHMLCIFKHRYYIKKKWLIESQNIYFNFIVC